MADHSQPPHIHELAERLGYAIVDDELITAIEGACVTGKEWDKNPDDCVMRVRGVLEEMDNAGG